MTAFRHCLFFFREWIFSKEEHTASFPVKDIDKGETETAKHASQISLDEIHTLHLLKNAFQVCCAKLQHMYHNHPEASRKVPVRGKYEHADKIQKD